ncbi:hypothetical protein HZH68_014363 [Vespula germanica]|uniref:Uncharacterized protein n=1 Tax=Vespula germanica TaxID=30212 RepID=A0A834JFQ8_VESGE|nr:hypothetical protein HZH68_014363 [Vespula germanica]
MRGSERSLRARNPKRQHFGRSQDSTGFETSRQASKQACFSILWEVLPPDGGGDSATSLYSPCLTPLPHISLQAESPTAETNAFSRDSIP